MQAHFSESEETQKGHMCNMRQGVRSTKKRVRARKNINKSTKEVTDFPPSLNAKHQDVFTCVFDLQDEMQAEIYDKMQDRVYTNQTGKFLVQSSKGYQYIMVMINKDSSYMSMEPMKNRHSSQITTTFQIMIVRLKACRINPKHHVLDNECF